MLVVLSVQHRELTVLLSNTALLRPLLVVWPPGPLSFLHQHLPQPQSLTNLAWAYWACLPLSWSLKILHIGHSRVLHLGFCTNALVCQLKSNNKSYLEIEFKKKKKIIKYFCTCCSHSLITVS